jgi:hypothetical protein
MRWIAVVVSALLLFSSSQPCYPLKFPRPSTFSSGIRTTTRSSPTSAAPASTDGKELSKKRHSPSEFVADLSGDYGSQNFVKPANT